MEGKTKRVLDFLLLRPAFTGRNLFSIFLVMLFVGVYIASGGRVHSLPKIKPGAQFGAVESQPGSQAAEQVTAPTEAIKGLFGKGESNTAQHERKEESAVDGSNAQSTESPAQKLEKLRNRLKQTNQKQ